MWASQKWLPHKECKAALSLVQSTKPPDFWNPHPDYLGEKGKKSYLVVLKLNSPPPSLESLRKNFRKVSVFQSNTFLEPSKEASGANIVYGTSGTGCLSV